MKHILLLFVVLSASMNMNAQTMKIYKGETLVKEYDITEADKVVFEDAKVDSHEYVDLGLPSGTLWATCNLGASKPESYGLYFAWGDTNGHTSDTSDGYCYTWSNYKFGEPFSLQKYCTSSYYGNVDNKIIIESSDDAATSMWGSSWCTPTHDQQTELINTAYTTTSWMALNGIYGRLITSKKNGKSIFIPAAGQRADNDLLESGSMGYYWSSTLYVENNDYAYSMGLSSSYIQWNGNHRCIGRTIRPVRSKE